MMRDFEAFITEEYIDKVDKDYYSPGERATTVLNMINMARTKMREAGVPEHDIPSDWDILAFAVEWCNLKFLEIGEVELATKAARVSNHFYSIHYTQPERIYGTPDRKAEDDGSVREEGTQVPSGERRRDLPNSSRDHAESPPSEGSGGTHRTGDALREGDVQS